MMNRSPLTILHTIRKHDQEHPDQAIFPHAAPDLNDEERTQIVRGYRRGLPLRSLAQGVCRNRSAVYRVILEERLAKLNKRKVKFIDDPLYHQDDAADTVATIAGAGRAGGPAARRKTAASRATCRRTCRSSTARRCCRRPGSGRCS